MPYFTIFIEVENRKTWKLWQPLSISKLWQSTKAGWAVFGRSFGFFSPLLFSPYLPKYHHFGIFWLAEAKKPEKNSCFFEVKARNSRWESKLGNDNYICWIYIISPKKPICWKRRSVLKYEKSRNMLGGEERGTHTWQHAVGDVSPLHLKCRLFFCNKIKCQLSCNCNC